MSYSIGLEGLRIFAHHGVYENERTVGNYFLLHLEVIFSDQLLPEIDDINLVPSYVLLNEIAQQEMAKTQQLLEMVVQNIARQIWLRFPNALTTNIELRKENPPIGVPCQYSLVKVELTRPIDQKA
jgi:dihydroneopterin aldolase